MDRTIYKAWSLLANKSAFREKERQCFTFNSDILSYILNENSLALSLSLAEIKQARK